MTKIKIITDKPIAFDSPDHLKPWGTASDNSVNRLFNYKLKLWLKDLRVLDLGCAGGGFVKSLIEGGDFAVGIEGSDYSKIRKRAEWATIPEYLFTADITEPFQLIRSDKQGKEHPLKFNVITAWEVMEHIEEKRLNYVTSNIKKHLSSGGGVVIVSISDRPEIVNGISLHQTVRSRDWWIEKFTELGYGHHDWARKYFGYDWLRGEKIEDAFSFNLVLTRRGEGLPNEERLKWLLVIFYFTNPILNLYHYFRWAKAKVGGFINSYSRVQ